MIPQQLERLYLQELPWELRLLSGPVRQHIERYQFASSRVIGLNVLDVACGSGYGAAILAKEAKAVAGVDISNHAIHYAQDKYGSDQLTFSVSKAEDLPFEDNTFDVVISFETIEHLASESVDNFLKEIVRVLKPGGKLFLSSPDNRNLSLGFSSSNPFHVQEFTLNEIDRILPEKLTIIEYYGQEFRSSSLIKYIRKFAKIIPPSLLQRIWRLGNGVINCTGKVVPWDKSDVAVPLYFLIEAQKND